MIKKQNPKTLFEKKDIDLTTVLNPSQINFPGQINDYLNKFVFKYMLAVGTNRLQQYVFHDCHTRNLKMMDVFISNVRRFFFFYFCNRFQYQQFSKLTSFCRINVLILEFGILLIKCIAKMHKIT